MNNSMSVMRKSIIITLLLLASAPVLLGQESDALPFTRIDRNPVTSALAGSGSASLGNTAYSAFSNASILPFYEGRMDASVSWQNWAPELDKATHVNAGIAFKATSRLGFSLGYAFLNGSGIEILDDLGLPSESLTPKEHLLAFGAGYGLSEKWSIGVNARYAMQILSENEKYNGFSGDLFVMFAPMTSLRLSAGVSTLGTEVESAAGKTFAQPASVKAAAFWTALSTDEHRVSLSADADYFFSGQFGAAAGVEYAWKSTVFVRGGYRFASEECVIPSHLGVGVGVSFAGFRVDLSYLTASDVLGNTLNAGLGYRF